MHLELQPSRETSWRQIAASFARDHCLNFLENKQCWCSAKEHLLPQTKCLTIGCEDFRKPSPRLCSRLSPIPLATDSLSHKGSALKVATPLFPPPPYRFLQCPSVLALLSHKGSALLLHFAISTLTLICDISSLLFSPDGLPYSFLLL